MKIGKGVEWAAHACTLLAALPDRWALSAEALASYHDVPAAYLAKQMQALSKAGLVVSARGANGGYRLARPATEISLWDITAAIEGTLFSFRCMNVRQNGPCGMAREDCVSPCGIAATFYRAEEAFRASLGEVSIADMLVSAAMQGTPDAARQIADWVAENATVSSPAAGD